MKYLLLVIFLIAPALAQQYSLEWEDTVNITSYDNATAITVKNDRVYVIGYFGNISYFDIVIMEYDTSGYLMRMDTLNLTTYDYGTDIVKDDNGNLYLGSVIPQGTDYYYGIIKINPNWQIEWIDTIPNGVDPWFQCHLALDENGNVYVAGNVITGNLNIFVTKISPSGERIWTNIFDYGSDDDAMSIYYGGGYIYIAGKTHHGSNDDIYIGKISPSDGTLIWHNTIDYGSDDQAWGITSDNTGFLYITGFVKQNGNKNLYVARLRPSDGTVQWSTTFDRGRDDWGNGVVADDSGHIIVTGGSQNAHNSDLIVLEYDNSGNLIWADTVDHGNSDSGHDIAIDDLGNIYIAGISQLANQDIINYKYLKNPTGVGERHLISNYYIECSTEIGRLLINYNLPDNSTLYVINSAGRTLKRLKASGKGNLVLKNLPSGVYGIYATGVGFKKTVVIR